MNNQQIEQHLRESTMPLPPHLRNRVLDACAAKAREDARRNRRANWRLAWGFAVVCAIHFGVGGMLDAKQQALTGTSPSDSARYADAASQADIRQSVLLRSQLLAELSDPHRRYF